MICRLCLNNFNGDHAVALFIGKYREKTENVDLIAKYFQLNLSSDDQISIHICSDCCDRLEDFHNFWLYVADKQSDLEKHEIFLCSAKLITSNVEKNIMVITDQRNDEVPAEDDILNDLYEENDFSVESDSLDFNTSLDFEEQLGVEAMASSHDFKDSKDVCLEEGNENSIEYNIGKTMVITTEQQVVGLQEYLEQAGSSQESTEVVPVSKESLNTANKAPKKKENTAVAVGEDIINNFLRLSCDICKEPATTYAALRKHFKLQHKSTAYVKCCGETYEDSASLLDHITWHKNRDIFKCDICNKQMRSKATLLSHKAHFHHNLKKLSGPLSCSLCKKRYQYNAFLAKHLQTHGENLCETCAKSSKRPTTLRQHIRSIHEDILPYTCTVCGQKYSTKASFTNHIKVHRAFVPPKEQCIICKKGFKDKSSLRSHLNSHNKVTYNCKYCERVCPSRKALSKHTIYMHKMKKTFKCDFCDKAFKTAWVLEEHTATHTGKQLYVCTQCGKQCRSRSNMYAHVKRIHFEYWQKTKTISCTQNDPQGLHPTS